jgi:hypothetical protein
VAAQLTASREVLSSIEILVVGYIIMSVYNFRRNSNRNETDDDKYCTYILMFTFGLIETLPLLR